MCIHYQGVKNRERYFRAFGHYPPDSEGRYDVWPGYEAPFYRHPREVDTGDAAVPACEALTGQFGLLRHWAKDDKVGRRTFNARSETAAKLPSFRDARRDQHHCIIPADAIFEPDWRSEKAVATRITRADSGPMGIAGLLSWWKAPAGDTVHRFTMLTVNAAEH